jgi:hypothetical protein
MREAGERLLAGYRGFVSIAGTGEVTTLLDHGVDLITADQAAHWFDLRQARAEFLRILRSGGWAALIWNQRRTDSTSSRWQPRCRRSSMRTRSTAKSNSSMTPTSSMGSRETDWPFGGCQ